MPARPAVPHASLNVRSVYGLIGLLAALVVHASTFTASSLSPDNPLFWIMHVAIFPLFIPMVYGLRKWSEMSSGPFGIERRGLRWRAVLQCFPRWAVAAGAVLFVYAMMRTTTCLSLQQGTKTRIVSSTRAPYEMDSQLHTIVARPRLSTCFDE
jgi:hypothetical protein